MDNKYIKPIENLSIGKIIEVDGSRIIAELDPTISDLSRVFAGENYPIGQFGSIIKVHFGRRSIYGLVSRLRMKADYQLEKGLPVASSDERIIEADLFGEGEWRRKDENEFALEFERGVATYPLPQQTIYLTPKSELRFIYGDAKGAVIQLGEHVGSGGAPCYAELNELLGKHTAILGSTGAGKSGTVAAVIHSILERGQIANHEHWHPQIIILDPHNEYGKAFPAHQRLSTDEGSLRLPYWLLDLEESLSLFIGKTEFAATSQSNIVKNALIAVREQAAEQLGLDKNQLTVDSPIPYIIGDSSGLDHFGKKDGELYTDGLIGAINQQRPSGANKKDHEDYSKVIRKIDSLLKDGRLKFMMESWDGDKDPLPAIVNQFLTQKATVQIVDLSGVPNEVAGVASAAIARIVFQLKVWQTEAERQNSPVLLVCEEAHRYVPNRGEAQYEAAQSAIRRIAKEGRKYGVGLLLVSQRPSEVEATVLSQCNSWIVLRITNDSDREHVRSVLPDSMSGLTKMLSGLRRQEAIFVGQAATLPTRVMIRSLSEEQLPRSNDVDFDKGWQEQAMTIEQIGAVVTKWRYQSK
ncbi:AAA-like domain protein [Vibrio vulnificus]|uniref:ATP-binding protein n=1 Tax=bacterium 19MO03SA05 TaxID=2920620 RepID=A0AAU6VDR2_UNCXX|nr:ATP-binding protein [Vibrio vulnificus]EKO3922322.1 ATP-binding protein [Vibrio metschnikovii]OJI28626.1 AAA-like domain protein [Vibrio vulnificus]OJI50849.1 AAA-like domain protein [Vibrio vulnificus]POB08832.1 ATP-binding protein [Vibrio vulnificus]